MDGDAYTSGLVPHLVVAAYDELGHPQLTENAEPAQMAMGDLTGVVSLWSAPAAPFIPGDVGETSSDTGFAAAGQVKFGRSWIAPAADGEFDFSAMTSGPLVGGREPGFHRTDTLDLGVVTAGEAELRLENGAVATLRPGSCFVITGMQHAWHVLGEEAFVFTVFTLGAVRST